MAKTELIEHEQVAAQQPRAEPTTDAIVALTKLVSELKAEVQALKIAPPTPATAMQRTASPQKNLRKLTEGMEKGEERGGISSTRALQNPYNTQQHFRSGNIVQLKKGSEKDTLYRNGLKRIAAPIPDEQPIFGQVLQEMRPTNSRNGEWKYKVEFKGIGKDGVLESELEFVQDAVYA